MGREIFFSKIMLEREGVYYVKRKREGGALCLSTQHTYTLHT